MTKKIIILLFAFVALHANAETLEIDGFVITTSTGCQIILSLDGEITNVTMPSGKIMLDSSGKVESVGGADIKRDSSGKIERVGGAVIERDSSGTIKSVDGTDIERDASGAITEVNSTKIERNEFGKIIGTDGSGVRVIFKVLAD